MKTPAKFGAEGNLKTTCCDFEEVLDGAEERTVVYCDPPYTMGAVL